MKRESGQEDASDATRYSSQSSLEDDAVPENSGQDGFRHEGEHVGEGVQDDPDVPHSVGECSPCHYMAARGTCKIGDKCKFCHESHDKPRVKPRPRRGIRKYCKGAVDQLDVIAFDQCLH